MSGISIISNFDVNQSVPIDSRLVATSSTERNAIQYKYAGLKVYQVDINRWKNEIDQMIIDMADEGWDDYDALKEFEQEN